MRRIVGYLKPYAGRMTAQLVIKTAGTVVELFLPWMLSKILDVYVPAKAMGQIYFWGALMVLCAGLALVGNTIANRMATAISRDAIKEIRHDLFSKILSLSAAQTDRFTVPSLISRMSTDGYNVHQMIDRMQRLGVRTPILLLGGMGMSFALEPVLTLVLVAVLPMLALVIWLVSRKGIPLYTKTQAAVDVMVRKVQENMTGVRVIKALSKTEYERERFEQANMAVVQTDSRAGRLMAITNPAMNLMLNLGLTMVIVVGAYRVNAGATQPGTIIAFLSYFTIILNALMMVSRLFVMYSKGAASAKRMQEVLDAPEEMQTKPDSSHESKAHVEFSAVCFSYNKVQPNLQEISFSLRRGETLGVIGPTGSGKSTLLALLLRLYDPDSGDIRIDGHPVDTIAPEILYSQFGVVFQNDFLSADTLRENIAFGRELTREQMERATQIAQADFIQSREGGLDAELDQRGSNLSGGQRQRVLIARAVAADPEILLLDDCSSALDYKTDAALRHALSRLRCSKIIVSQRISTVMSADRILMLDEGKAIGYGTHDELMKSCPSYREIFDIQMGEMS